MIRRVQEAVAAFGLAGIAWASMAQVKPPVVSFERHIAPLFKAKCVVCHNANSASGGLRLDTIDGIRKGGTSGPVFLSGKSSQSLLLKRILGEGGLPQMPMGFAPLSKSETDHVRAWIDSGASFERPKAAKHWAYKPPRRPDLPLTKLKGWTRNPIDALILARLERLGLIPSPIASREILLRRLSLDLTGLPPTVRELDAFLADDSPDAFERQVDRLLASPHYGEKMARTWLDLARYADTNGYEKDLPRQMWIWRNWVIDAFNKNMPFDQFTIEQLAGDLLQNPTIDQLIATGFHRNSMLNDEGGIDAEEFRVVAVMDRVDATATTWLGTTMACAQCHDHKYDPFSQRDYYRFYAFFNQTEDNGRDKDPLLKVPLPDQSAQLEKLEGDLSRAKQELTARTPSALAEQPEWEKRQIEGWTVLKPHDWVAEATLRQLPDNSLLASGKDPIEDRYSIGFTAPPSRIAGIRIEAIPDPSLPFGSSGRNFNGNFVLSKVVAKHLKPPTNPAFVSALQVPIEFSQALADFTQAGHDPMSVIRKEEGPGWAIAGFLPEQRVRHELVLKLAEPILIREHAGLALTLIHQSKHKNHNLGRFRVSVTSDVELASQKPLPATAYSALQKKPEARTIEERKALEGSYLNIAPDLLALNSRIARLSQQKADLESRIPSTMILRESPKPRFNRLLKRGDFRTAGDPVSPGTPVALGGYASRSNRLGLARWLVDAKNPLTARVQVNRLWEQIFGQGLVATPEDFGSQGEKPTHPGLLDWLATEYIRLGWDTKKLIKLIVTSATYRQSAKTSKQLLKRDPNNVFLARGPRFRVDAEGIRDIALAASGRLTTTVGGPSVMPPQPPGIWENSFTFYDTKDRWVDEEGPNRYRRGLYTFWRRTAPFPMALTFDLRTRDVCVTKRSRTNTPLQALNTLNDPLFIECAGALAKQMAQETNEFWRKGIPKDRIEEGGLIYGFRACTSRKPKPAELESLKKLLKTSYDRMATNSEAALAILKAARLTDKPELTVELAAYTVVANALLNLDETLTKG